MESTIGKASVENLFETYTKDMIFTVADRLALIAVYSLLNPLDGKYRFELYDWKRETNDPSDAAAAQRLERRMVLSGCGPA
ncbi:hypothetical protein L596_023195 [Steinernema carpocapsae]|uniref:Uncharacterized protein n=1 Tax=Steinernema carpocapsae TaxID=34508 RepID=A0A4V5ZZD0_STECR|nr:hypothetical protein L596_023195 [Steinernema carpocapsae]